MIAIKEDPFIVIPGRLNQELTAKICKRLNVNVHPIKFSKFPNGELDVEIAPPVRNHIAFIVFSPYPELDDQLMELLLIVDAVRRAAASRIVVILTLFPYSVDTRTATEKQQMEPTTILTRIPEEQRQRIQNGRLLAELLEHTRVDEVMSVELCQPQWEGLFHIPFTNLACHSIISNLIDEHVVRISNDCAIVPFQMHSSKRCDRILSSCKNDQLTKAMVYMRRNGQFLCSEGYEFADKHLFIVCDFLLECEELCLMVNWLIGTLRVSMTTVIIIHSLLSERCLKTITDHNGIDCVYISDSLPTIAANITVNRLKVFTMSDVIADGIQSIAYGKDVLLVTD